MQLLTALSALLLMAYPFAVYYGLNRWGMGVIALVLGGLFLLRILLAYRSRLQELKYLAWLSGSIGIILSLLASIFRSHNWLIYYPVLVNLIMFAVFASSLWQKQSMIERLARLQQPDLPASGVAYTRKVTVVWCGYFIINGTIAIYTCFQPLAVWTLYNGLLSYLFAASLFSIEWLVRRRLKAQ